MPDFTTALIACFRYHRSRNSVGSRRLFDAVNDAFCILGRVLLIVLAVLTTRAASAQDLHATPMDLGTRAAIATAIAGNVADLVTTKQAFDRGAVEGNGVLTGQPIKTLTVTKCIFTASIVGLEIIAQRSGHTRVAKWIGFVDGGVTLSVAAHNTRVQR